MAFAIELWFVYQLGPYNETNGKLELFQLSYLSIQKKLEKPCVGSNCTAGKLSLVLCIKFDNFHWPIHIFKLLVSGSKHKYDPKQEED